MDEVCEGCGMYPGDGHDRSCHVAFEIYLGDIDDLRKEMRERGLA